MQEKNNPITWTYKQSTENTYKIFSKFIMIETGIYLEPALYKHYMEVIDESKPIKVFIDDLIVKRNNLIEKFLFPFDTSVQGFISYFLELIDTSKFMRHLIEEDYDLEYKIETDNGVILYKMDKNYNSLEIVDYNHNQEVICATKTSMCEYVGETGPRQVESEELSPDDY